MEELKELLLKMDNRLDGIEKRLDGMEKRLDGIDNRLDGMDNRLESLELNQKLLFGEVRGLKNEMNDKFAEVKLDLNEIKSQLSDHGTDIRTLKRHDEWLDREVTKVIERIEVLEQNAK
jgi:chromosome segregation ATPase